MNNLLRFYFGKSIYNLRKRWLVVLSIGIAISAVIGLNFYSRAVFSNQFNDSFNFLQDFEISHEQIYGEHHSAIPKLRYSLNFQKDYSDILKRIHQSSLNIEGIYQYGILSMEEGFWVHDDFNSVDPLSTTSLFDYHRKLNRTEIEFFVSDNNFYSSSRFNEYFKVIEGDTPNNPQEILVEYRFAIQHGLNVGETTNITLFIGSDLDYSPPVVNYKTFQLENVTISGIYLATQNEYVFDTEKFEYSYTYSDYLANNKIRISLDSFDEPAMFSWYNFSGPDMTHPFQKLYSKIANDEWYYQYLRTAYTRSGYFLTYDRNLLDFNQIHSQYLTIQSYAKNLSIYLPLDHGFVDILSHNMKLFYNNFQHNKLIFQLLYFPIVLFSLSVSILFIKISKKTQEKEFFYLKSMGIPNKKILSLIIFESTLNGLVSAFLGLSFGYGTFYLYDFIFHDIFVSDSLDKLIPTIYYGNLIWALILSVMVNVFAVFQIIRTVNKYNLEKLSPLVKIEDIKSNIDEYILFSPKFEKKQKEHREKQITKNIKNLDSISTKSNINKDLHKGADSNNKPELFEKKKKRFTNRIKIKKINDEEDNFGNKSSLKTQIFFLFGIILISPMIFMILKNYFSLSDSMIDLVSNLENNYNLIEITIFIGVIFIIISTVRLISYEKPKIYAKILKLLSRISLGEFDKFVTVKMIKKKERTSILINITILFSALISLNIISNSTFVYSYLPNVYKTGADVSISYENANFRSLHDIDNCRNELKTITDDNNHSIIQEDAFFYISSYSYFSKTMELTEISQKEIQIISLELNKYVNIFTNSNLAEPSENFLANLGRIKNFNQNNGNISAIITTSYFLSKYNMNINDLFMISIRQYQENGQSTYLNLPVQIIAAMDIIPGVYYNGQTDFLETILIDFNRFSTLNHLDGIPGEHVKTLLKIYGYSNEIDKLGIQDSLIKILNNYCEYPYIYFQDFNWNQMNPEKISENTEQDRNIFGLFYYDFVIIGVFIIAELSILSLLSINSSKQIDQRLMERGMKRTKIIKFKAMEFGLLFLTALFLGLIFGVVSGIFFIKGSLLSNFTQIAGNLPPSFNFPIFGDFTQMVTIFGIHLGIAILFFLISMIKIQFFSRKARIKKNKIRMVIE